MSGTILTTKDDVRAMFYAAYLFLLATLNGWLAVHVATSDLPPGSALTTFDKVFSATFFSGLAAFFSFLVLGAILDFRQKMAARRKP